MSIKHISAVLIAKNAQNTIVETLESLLAFEEVVIYLNNSTDKTKEIVQAYGNVKIIEGDFIGFGPTKNLAATFASNDWILSLDSDEVILPKLLEELTNLDLNDANKVFILQRNNYFLGQEIKYSGWGKDFLVRLYNKTTHGFNQNKVHEYVAITQYSKQIKLKNSFKHNAVEDINQILTKVISYSDLASKDKKTCCFLLVLLKAIWAFFKTYLLQLGFLDGWRGFFIAATNGYSKFFRYTKRYINCKKS